MPVGPGEGPMGRFFAVFFARRYCGGTYGKGAGCDLAGARCGLVGVGSDLAGARCGLVGVGSGWASAGSGLVGTEDGAGGGGLSMCGFFAIFA